MARSGRSEYTSSSYALWWTFRQLTASAVLLFLLGYFWQSTAIFFQVSEKRWARCTHSTAEEVSCIFLRSYYNWKETCSRGEEEVSKEERGDDNLQWTFYKRWSFSFLLIFHSFKKENYLHTWLNDFYSKSN